MEKMQPTTNQLFKFSSLFSQVLLTLILLFFNSNIVNAQVTIASGTSVTWYSGNMPPTSSGNDYREGVFVDNDAELIINGLTLNMNVSKQIELDLGARLEVTNSTITSSNPVGNIVWGGILANGDLLSHFDVEPDTNVLDDIPAWEGTINDNETYVELNNSTISHAFYGVYSDRGAIIRARGTTFSDCGHGAHINYSLMEKCADYFMDCHFTWSKTNPNLTQSSLVGIYLQTANNINIGGCEFANNDVTKHCPNERGTGIQALDASFALSKSGNTFCKDYVACFENCYKSGTGTSNSNTFSKLSIGISLGMNVVPLRYSFVARRCLFQNNLIGITTNNTENTKIYKCEFSSTRAFLDDIFLNSGMTPCYTSTTTVQDIIFDDAMAWEAYDNTFTFTGANINHITAISSSLDRCRIQQNTFTNNTAATVATDNVNGIFVTNNNAFLEVYCNTFVNMGTDIKLVSGGFIVNPIGSATKPAENVFSSQTPGRFRIDNSSNPTNFYFYNSTKGLLHQPLEISGLSTAISSTGVSPVTERTCTLKCYQFYNDIKRIKIEDYVSMYPNPTSNQLNLSTELHIIKSVAIYNAMGQKVYEFNDGNTIYNHQVDVSGYNSGMYYIMLYTPFNTVITKKLIIAQSINN